MLFVIAVVASFWYNAGINENIKMDKMEDIIETKCII